MNVPEDLTRGSADYDRHERDESPPPGLGLSDEQFRDALGVLLQRIDSLPPEERLRLQCAADATRQRHDQLRLTVQRLQETLDTLRVSIKYLVFDVEATRRENDYLRRMLGERGDDGAAGGTE